MVRCVRFAGFSALSLFVFCFLAGHAAGATPNRSDSEQLAERTRLLLRLAETVHWPSSVRHPDFYIEVLDTTPQQHDPLFRIPGRREVHGKPLVVTQACSWAERNQDMRPHIFYVSAAFSKLLPQIHSHFNGLPVLVVSETPYSGAGWMAYFERVSRPARGADRARGGADSILVWSLNVTNMYSVAGLTTSMQTSKPKWVTRMHTPSERKGRELTLAAAMDSIPRLVELIMLQRDTVSQLRRQIFNLRSLLDSMRLAQPPRPFLPFAWTPPAVESAQVRVALARQQASSWPAPAGDSLLIMFLAVGIGTLVIGGSVAFAFTTQGGEWVRSAGALLLAALPSRRATRRSAGEPSRCPNTPNGARADGPTFGNMNRKRYLETVSHDIRTPLNAIVGLSQYIAEPTASEEEKRVGVGLISRSIFELTTRLNSMALLARLEAARIEERPVCVPLDDFLQHAVRLVEESVAAAGRADSLILRCVTPQGRLASILGDPDNLASSIEMLVALHVRATRCEVIEIGYERSEAATIRLFVRSVCSRDSRWPDSPTASSQRVDTDYIGSIPEGAAELAVALGLQELRSAQLHVVSVPSVGSEFSFCFREL